MCFSSHFHGGAVVGPRAKRLLQEATYEERDHYWSIFRYRKSAGQSASNGYGVVLASRRGDLLSEVAREIRTTSFVKVIDVSKPVESMRSLRALIAIRKRKKHVYVTRRWRLVAWLIKAMPDWLVSKSF
jgi:hypothetical protein